MKLLLTANADKCTQEQFNHVLGILSAQPETEVVSRYNHALPVGIPEETQAVIVMGGDGSIIHTCHEMGDNQKPIIGINFGKLGYLANFDMTSFEKHIVDILKLARCIIEHPRYENPNISKRTLLHVDGYGNGMTFHHLVVNDVVLDIGRPFRAIQYELHINGVGTEPSIPLATMSGDGIIVASPTGSTAYNLAAGGSIVEPELSGITITPKNVHKLSIRPLVVRDDQRIGIRVTKTDGAWVIIDGQLQYELSSKIFTAPFEINITRHRQKMIVINNPELDYWHILRTKLKWGV